MGGAGPPGDQAGAGPPTRHIRQEQVGVHEQVSLGHPRSDPSRHGTGSDLLARFFLAALEIFLLCF